MFYDMFLQLCEKKGVKPSRAAMDIDLSKATATKWKNGSIPTGDTLQKLANYFDVPVDYLLEKEISVDYRERWEKTKGALTFKAPENNNSFLKKVPILGTIACGEPILALQDVRGYAQVSNDIYADFCLFCKGDSMSPKINDGDLVLIHKQNYAYNEDIVAALINEEATLKKLQYKDSTLILRPENPDYPLLVFSKEEINKVYLIGKVVGIIRKFEYNSKPLSDKWCPNEHFDCEYMDVCDELCWQYVDSPENVPNCKKYIEYKQNAIEDCPYFDDCNKEYCDGVENCNICSADKYDDYNRL